MTAIHSAQRRYSVTVRISPLLALAVRVLVAWVWCKSWLVPISADREVVRARALLDRHFDRFVRVRVTENTEG